MSSNNARGQPALIEVNVYQNVRLEFGIDLNAFVSKHHKFDASTHTTIQLNATGRSFVATKIVLRLENPEIPRRRRLNLDSPLCPRWRFLSSVAETAETIRNSNTNLETAFRNPSI
ncbi:hypothetical protein CEXT_77551 [Caerostris extrusa]|uniref:Uncharacterized protein n=1 Tax=Caerostris extrusa TaxID=172846 RepID=A0AAV4N509_CAEEX|nr:hypothetical protein CEXT_77551 [Caerostris extrusa]